MCLLRTVSLCNEQRLYVGSKKLLLTFFHFYYIVSEVERQNYSELQQVEIVDTHIYSKEKKKKKKRKKQISIEISNRQSLILEIYNFIIFLKFYEQRVSTMF